MLSTYCQYLWLPLVVVVSEIYSNLLSAIILLLKASEYIVISKSEKASENIVISKSEWIRIFIEMLN